MVLRYLREDLGRKEPARAGAADEDVRLGLRDRGEEVELVLLATGDVPPLVLGKPRPPGPCVSHFI